MGGDSGETARTCSVYGNWKSGRAGAQQVALNRMISFDKKVKRLEESVKTLKMDLESERASNDEDDDAWVLQAGLAQ